MLIWWQSILVRERRKYVFAFQVDWGIVTRLVAVYQGLRLADLLPSKHEGVPLPVTIRPLCRLSDELSTYAIFHADAAGRVCCWLSRDITKREGTQ